MKVFIKKEVYFEISIEDSTDRSVVTSAFEQVLEPAFREFLTKVRFNPEEVKALQQLTGKNMNIRIMSKTDFLKQTNQK